MNDLKNPPFAGLGEPIVEQRPTEGLTAKQLMRKIGVSKVFELCERNTKVGPPYHLKQERVMSENGLIYTKVVCRGTPIAYFRAGIGTAIPTGTEMIEMVVWPIDSE